jgi:hypothetical protein
MVAFARSHSAFAREMVIHQMAAHASKASTGQKKLRSRIVYRVSIGIEFYDCPAAWCGPSVWGKQRKTPGSGMTRVPAAGEAGAT